MSGRMSGRSHRGERYSIWWQDDKQMWVADICHLWTIRYCSLGGNQLIRWVIGRPSESGGTGGWSYEEIQLANIDKYIWELSRNTVDELRVIWHLGWSGDQPAILPFCKTFGGENSRCSQNLERGKIDKLQLNCEKYNWGSVRNTVHKLQEIHLINCEKYSWWIVRNTVD